MKGATGGSMGGRLMRPQRSPGLNEAERSLLGHVRARPGVTPAEVAAATWWRYSVQTAWRAAAHLCERGLVTHDHGRLYARRSK